MLNGFSLRRAAHWLLAVCIILFGANVYGAAPGDCSANTTGYWPLEGTDYTDAIGSNGTVNDATCTNCPTSTTEGLIDDGQTFDGTNDELEIAAHVDGVSSLPDTVFDWDATDNFSIALWMKHNGAAGGAIEVMAGRIDGATLQWWIGLSANTGRALFRLRDSDDVAFTGSLTGTRILTDDEWHFIVAVRDNTAEKNLLYVDGRLEDSADSITYDADFASATAQINFGSLDSAFFFDGVLDEIAVFDVALSQAQIRQHYVNGLASLSYCPDDTAPTIVSEAPTTANVGPYYYDVNASGSPAPTFSLADGAPEGMTIDSSTGEITWSPSDRIVGESDLTFTVTATNSQGSDSQAVTVEVLDLCASELDAYLPLDEDLSDPLVTEYSDQTLNGNTGTGRGGNYPAVETTDVVAGNAQDFDGTNDGIDIAAREDNGTPITAFDWPVGSSFSVSLWMKRPDGAPGAIEVLAGRMDGVLLQWWIGVQATTGEALFRLRDEDDAAFVGSINSKALIADGEWHHLVAVRDHANLSNLLYVDGVLVASTDGIDYDAGFTSLTAETNIGHLDGSFWFNGLIDEVTVFQRALSSAMIKQQYDRGVESLGFCNQAPAITTSAGATATEDVAYTYSAAATDADGDTADLVWSLENAPSGMTVGSDTGVVSWTPVEGVTSSGQVTLIVTDEYGGTDFENFTISVTAVNDAPQITGPASISMDEDTTLTLTEDNLEIVNSENDDLTFTLVKVGDDYTVSGATITPNANFFGDFTVQVTANDGSLDSNTFDLTVTVNAVNDAPEITSDAPTEAETGELYTYAPEASDVENDTLTWSLTDPPTDMTIDAETGEISWTPPEGTAEEVTFTLEVSDGTDSDTQEITVTVSGDTSNGGGGGGGGGCFIDTAGPAATASGTTLWMIVLGCIMGSIGILQHNARK